MMHCSETREAQNLMHDQIANTLITSISKALKGKRTGHDVQKVTTHFGKRIDAIWPDCPENIAAFVPDGIIIRDSPPGCKIKQLIIILEFARCYSVELLDLEDNAAVKRNQYHSTAQYLTRQYPRHSVQTFGLIMSIFGTIPQDTWLAHFNAANLTPAQAKQIQHDCIRACITAGFALHNTYSSRIEALRSAGADTSSPGQRLNRTGIG